jgi:methionyl aminopeptidase
MVIIKTNNEIEKLKRSGKIVAEVLYELKNKTKPGIDTLYLNNIAEKIAKRRGALPGFKNYNGFPFSICASINEVVIHGLPSNDILQEGDVLGIDFGILFDGYYCDAAITVPVGRISEQDKNLLEVTEKALYKGIAKALHLGRLSDISHAIQTFVESKGFYLVRGFGGHGVGRQLHEPPHISNIGEPNEGLLLKSGIVLAIEPMVLSNGSQTKTLNDNWSVVSVNEGNTAHFEHTIVITNGEPIILTK